MLHQFFLMDAMFYFFLDILMSSTYIDKNNPCLQRTNRHCQVVIIHHPSLNKTSWNYRSENTYWFCSRETTGSSILDRDFRHLCLGRRIHTSGHSDFGIFSNLGTIFQCYLDFCRYCIRCSSFTICKFCNYIHDFRRSHLWRRRSLICEYSISVCVIFYNAITEVPHVLCTSVFFIPTQHFSSDMFSSLKQSGLSFVSLRLQDDFFLTSDL